MGSMKNLIVLTQKTTTNMENKPEYRFKFEIVDATNNEVLVTTRSFMSARTQDGSNENVDMEIGSALRQFNIIKARYEAKNYPTSVEDSFTSEKDHPFANDAERDLEIEAVKQAKDKKY